MQREAMVPAMLVPWSPKGSGLRFVGWRTELQSAGDQGQMQNQGFNLRSRPLNWPLSSFHSSFNWLWLEKLRPEREGLDPKPVESWNQKRTLPTPSFFIHSCGLTKGPELSLLLSLQCG